MIVIALMLALVEKPMRTWTRMNVLLMLKMVISDPMEKGMRQQVHNKKLVSNSTISCEIPTKLVMPRV